MRAESVREPASRRTPRAQASPPADLLLGRYRLGPVRERTATSTVHEGLEDASGRTVAIEIASGVTRTDARERLLRDATFAEGLEGDHVLTVWEATSLPDGTPVIVREPTITTLAKEIAARGPFPTEIAAGFTLDVAEAIAEAHALGVAHGDLDPESVVLVRSRDGRLRLAVSWTTPKKTLGAISATAAADLAGLGRILRALVSGAPASSAASEEEAAGDDGAKTLPNGVAHVVARALAPASVRSSGAYPSLAEMVRDLATLAPHAHPSAQGVERLLWQDRPTSPETPSARPPAPRAADRPDPHAGDPVQPVPWLGHPEPDTVVAPLPHGRARLLVASVVLAGIAVLFAWALDRALPRVGTGARTTLGATAFEGAPETRALADRVTTDAVWSFARSLPASSAPAERERAGDQGPAPAGSDVELDEPIGPERSPSPLHAPDATAPFELGPIDL